MTQTTTKRSGKYQVDIYSKNGNQERYCYTVETRKISFQEFVDQGVDFEDLIEDQVKALEVFAKSNGKPIWHCTGEKGNYSEYFLTKKDAVDDMLSQNC